MIQPIRLLNSSVFAALAAFALSIFWTAAVQADEQPVASISKTSDTTEFTRFLESTMTPEKPALATTKPGPAVTCNAVENQVEVLGTIRNAEMKLAEMRKHQLAAWAAKGWTEKDAAAAGEAVMLNGSGYNIKTGQMR